MRFVLAFLGLLCFAQSAIAQGCGQQNPNCIVPDRPSGDSTEAAANTKFVNGQGFASLTATDQTVTGGANVTPLGQTAGNITIDCGKSPLQFIPNTGAFTITAPSIAGSCILLVQNGSGAGAISFSGFNVGSNTGDPLDATNGHNFSIFIWRLNGLIGYRVAAHQ